MTNPLLHNALLRGESSPHNVHHRGAITARVRRGQAEKNGGEEKNLEKDMIKFLGTYMAKILYTIIFFVKKVVLEICEFGCLITDYITFQNTK